MLDLFPPDLDTLDRLAALFFFLAWLGYGRLIHAPALSPNITTRMHEVRVAWMRAMLDRDNRVADASLLGNVIRSATFFASTTVLALAALLGLLGKLDLAYATTKELIFTVKTSQDLIELKILLLMVVFAHTFVKLTWALRQMNYCVALIGSAPLKPPPAERDVIARRIAAVLSLAVRSFNTGIRGYYFSLAALTWFVGPKAFLATTAGIVGLLLWRQFASATAEAIRLAQDPAAADRHELAAAGQALPAV